MEVEVTEVREPPGWTHQEIECTEETIQTVLDRIMDILPWMAQEKNDEDIYRLLKIAEAQPWSGLKPRSREYIGENIYNFITLYDGPTLTACGEMIEVDSHSLELGAVATNPDYYNLGMSDKVITFAEQYAKNRWKNIILVTDTALLIDKLVKKGYADVTVLYKKRAAQSPGKKIYAKVIS